MMYQQATQISVKLRFLHEQMARDCAKIWKVILDEISFFGKIFMQILSCEES